MDLFQVIVLSIVEGVTEFIPVSSTGHLIIVERLFGWNVPFAFDLIIQLGAYSAVFFFFREKILKIFLATTHFLLSKISGRHFDEKERIDARLGISILVASIPSALAGILFQKFIEKNLHTGLIVALGLIIFGLVMNFFDKKTDLKKNINTASFGDIFKIGLWQVLSLIPGVSRSGSTMSGAMALGFKREAAAELAFIFGLPIVIGAGAKGILDIITGKEAFSGDISMILIGFVLSFIVGVISIRFLVNFLKSNSFKPFVTYRIIAGVLFLLLFLIIGG